MAASEDNELRRAQEQTGSSIHPGSAETPPYCELCEEELVTAFCDNCEEHFCRRCAKGHQKQKATKDHTVRDLSSAEISGAAKEVDKHKLVLKCDVHSNSDITMMCKTCSEMVCADCVSGKHSGHALCELSEGVSLMQNLCLELAKIRNEDLRKMQDMEIHAQADVQKLKGITEQNIDTLDQRHKEVVNIINTVTLKARETLNTEQENVQKRFNDIIRSSFNQQSKSQTLLKQMLELSSERNFEKLASGLQDLRMKHDKMTRENDSLIASVTKVSPLQLKQEDDLESIVSDMFEVYRPCDTYNDIKKLRTFESEDIPKPEIIAQRIVKNHIYSASRNHVVRYNIRAKDKLVWDSSQEFKDNRNIVALPKDKFALVSLDGIKVIDSDLKMVQHLLPSDRDGYTTQSVGIYDKDTFMVYSWNDKAKDKERGRFTFFNSSTFAVVDDVFTSFSRSGYNDKIIPANNGDILFLESAGCNVHRFSRQGQIISKQSYGDLIAKGSIYGIHCDEHGNLLLGGNDGVVHLMTAGGDHRVILQGDGTYASGFARYGNTLFVSYQLAKGHVCEYLLG